LAIKYLAGERLVGTAAERLAMLPSTFAYWYEHTTQTADSSPITKSSGYDYIAAHKILSANSDEIVKRVSLYLKKNNASFTGTLYCRIYSDSATRSVIATGTYSGVGYITGSQLTTSYVWYDFDFDGVEIDTGYRVGVENESDTGTTNWAKIGYSVNDGSEKIGTGGTSWSSYPELEWNIKISGTSTYPDLTNGTIFEETDTFKHYMWDGTDTWNEVT